MIKRISLFVIVLLQTVLLVSITSTQLVLADISGFGIAVPAGDRLSATLHDVAGLGPTLLVMFTPTLMIAFVIAGFASKYFRGYRTLWFCAAGCLSLPAVILVIRLAMGATVLASARTTPGMLVLAAVGLAGGWVYARLTAAGNA